MMEVISYIVLGAIVLVLLISLYGMWTINSDPMTDHELFGMSGEAYSLKMMGDEEFKKHFTEEEYKYYKKELDGSK